MSKKAYSYLKPWFINVIGVIAGVFFVSIMVYGASTIGDNINTDGNLTVSGAASTTSATSTRYMYVGSDGTEPAGWDFSSGDLFVFDDVFMNSQATSSASFWVGSGGTATNINVAGGDLYVQDAAEIDGTLFFALATGTSATSTAYLYLGSDGTEPAGWDFAGGDLFVFDDVFMNSQATSSASFWVGSGGTATNINVAGGDLYVQDAAEIDGTLFFASATGTSATSTAYEYIGSDGTEPAGWDFAGGDLFVFDDVFMNSQATSSASFWVGSGGTATNINVAGGDLYVQDAAEIDGTLFFARATGTSATSTAYEYIGPDATEPAGWNFEGGDLFVADDAVLNSQATTTVSMWIGSAGTATQIDLAGGDLYVQDAAEIDGDVFVGGGTLSLTTGTPTTTAGLFVGPTAGTSTTTLGIGDIAQAGCLELTRRGGGFYRLYLNEAGTAWVIQTGRCN